MAVTMYNLMLNLKNLFFGFVGSEVCRNAYDVWTYEVKKKILGDGSGQGCAINQFFIAFWKIYILGF